MAVQVESLWTLKFKLQVCDLHLFFSGTVSFLRFWFSFLKYYIFIQSNAIYSLPFFYIYKKFKSRVVIDQDIYINVTVCISCDSTFMFLYSCCNFKHAFLQFSLLRWHSSPACLSWISAPQTSDFLKWFWSFAHVSRVPIFPSAQSYGCTVSDMNLLLWRTVILSPASSS